MLTGTTLTDALKEEALRLGFDLVGATPAVAPPQFDRFEQWLADGFAGQMHYLADRRDAYRHPDRLLKKGTGSERIDENPVNIHDREVPVPVFQPVAKSLLMLGMNYRTGVPVEAGPGQLRVSRYAWGKDYHEVIRDRLHKLADFHRRLTPGAGVRGIVDTAPLLERQFGQLAGLGWIGKNTMLINERLGSWFFLAALLTTEELAYDEPCTADRCGSCRACLDACPTGALVEPHRLDARKCISYLTIELRGAFSEPQRESCRGRLFGCDACQESCPWNRRTPATREPAFHPGPGMNPVALAEIASLDEQAFRRRFRHTPLWRARREGILRNAEEG